MSSQDFSKDTIEGIMADMLVHADAIEKYMAIHPNHDWFSQKIWIKDIRDFAHRIGDVLKRQEKLDESVSDTFGMQLSEEEKNQAIKLFHHYLMEMDHKNSFAFSVAGWHIRCYWDEDVDKSERYKLLTFKALNDFSAEFVHYLRMDCYDFSFAMNGLCIDAGEMASIDLDEVRAELEDL